MVRRTKEEALETRNRLLDAAEALFQRGGVSRTSLHDIAEAAGVTRGAIYWHFKDKAAIVDAMMERVTLPLEECALREIAPVPADPLLAIREMSQLALRKLATSAQARRVFDIVLHRMEYVDEQLAVRDRRLAKRNRFLDITELNLREAAQRGIVHKRLSPRTQALGLFALYDGLVQNWLLDPTTFDLLTVGTQLIDAYLDGLRLAPNIKATPKPAQRASKTRAARLAQ